MEFTGQTHVTPCDSFFNHLQAVQVKSNILRFSGFVWHDNEVIIIPKTTNYNTHKS